MKRWGLIGLVAVAGCAPETSSYREAQNQVCPNVTAGELTGVPQGLSDSHRPEGDGREPVFIRYRGDGVSAASRVRQLGIRVTATYRSVPAVAARVTPEERHALSLDPLVEAIEPDSELHALGPATLPVLGLASRAAKGTIAGEYTDGLRKVQANLVWDRDGDGLPDLSDGTQDPTLTTGQRAKVCIIDSGLDLQHPELRDAVVARRDFLDGDDVPSDQDPKGVWGSGHGTHVAGIIAARAGVGGQGTPVLQGNGLVGVAPGTQLIIARVLDIYGRTQMSTVLEAVEYCAKQGANVASLSLGGGLATRTSLLAFKAAFDSKMLVVAAAGNDGGHLVSYPASDPSVLAVGAVDALDRKADFSNTGDELALMAPGVDVLSTFPSGQGAFSMLELDNGNKTRPLSRPLLYGPTTRGVGGELVDCGTGDSLDSCDGSSCSGFIAYVRPGRVPIEQAVVNVMLQGARAVIFSNTSIEGGVEIYSLPKQGNWVPAITVNQAGSTLLNRQLSDFVRIEVQQADYAYMSGTSMATPYVSGVAALLFSAFPDATPGQVRKAMLSSARDLGPGGHDNLHGNGLVQAMAAMNQLKKDLSGP